LHKLDDYPNLKTKFFDDLDDAQKARFVGDFKDAGDEVFDFFEGNANGVKAWESVFLDGNAASLLISRNTIILGKVNDLLSTGIVAKVDLEFFVEALSKLKNRNIPDADLEHIAEYVLEARKHTNQWTQFGLESDLLGQIYKMADSPKYKNPEDLRYFLGEPGENTGLAGTVGDNPGHLEQLNEAVRKLKAGKDIKLEGGDGDIVNVTDGLSFQYKAYRGTSSTAFNVNLKKAADQFNSEPTSLNKIAKVKILNSSEQFYNSSAQVIRNKIQELFNGSADVANNFRALKELQVDNANGLLRFEVVDDIVFTIY